MFSLCLLSDMFLLVFCCCSFLLFLTLLRPVAPPPFNFFKEVTFNLGPYNFNESDRVVKETKDKKHVTIGALQSVPFARIRMNAPKVNAVTGWGRMWIMKWRGKEGGKGVRVVGGGGGCGGGGGGVACGVSELNL